MVFLSSTTRVWFLTLVLCGLCLGDVRRGRASARLRSWGEPEILMPTEKEGAGEGDRDSEEEPSTRWAVLVAGSSGYSNYRHQADVCHAYQILKKGGLKEENIVVFMYDDIAMHELNPRHGTIINHPTGEDVYAGVPKFFQVEEKMIFQMTLNYDAKDALEQDYTGKNVTAENLYAVLLGDKKALKGGSGKVINSTAEDRIFVYYSDHGGPGVLGMPNFPFLYAGDFIEVLKKKHAAGSYKEMVIYVESCESGSMFEGMLPEDLNVYVTTASNAQESSYGTYCPGMDPSPPPEYITCLGDLYSVAWMEDSESHNLKKETVKQQYKQVKLRTSNFNTYNAGSHVMQYGNKSIEQEKLYLYQGFDPASVNLPPNKLNFDAPLGVVNQRDADLHSLWQMCKRSEGELEKGKEILGEITNIMKHRVHLDTSIEIIGMLLFGPGKGSALLGEIRDPGLPLVDDWQCLKSMVRVFESHCGSLTQYGMKHMRAFANVCNRGVSEASMEEACVTACYGLEAGHWHPSNVGYSS